MTRLSTKFSNTRFPAATREPGPSTREILYRRESRSIQPTSATSGSSTAARTRFTSTIMPRSALQAVNWRQQPSLSPGNTNPQGIADPPTPATAILGDQASEQISTEGASSQHRVRSGQVFVGAVTDDSPFQPKARNEHAANLFAGRDDVFESYVRERNYPLVKRAPGDWEFVDEFGDALSGG